MSEVYFTNGNVAVGLPVGTTLVRIDTTNYGDSLEVTFFDKDLRPLRVDGGLDPDDTYRLSMVTADSPAEAVRKGRSVPDFYQHM